MSRMWPNMIKDHGQKIFACVALVFVLIGSCPVKASIKNLIGIPVNTEQSAPKSMHAFQVNTAEKCAAAETTEVKILQTDSSGTSALLLAVFFTLIFSCLPGFPLTKTQLHPGNRKIPSALPVFLRYRRLLI